MPPGPTCPLHKLPMRYTPPREWVCDVCDLITKPQSSHKEATIEPGLPRCDKCGGEVHYSIGVKENICTVCGQGQPPELEDATKYDEDKLRYDLLPAEMLEGIVKVYHHGAKKYGDANYKKGGGLYEKRLYSAAMRHIEARRKGEIMDPESGINHLFHAVTNLLFICELYDDKPNEDTGTGPGEQDGMGNA